MDKTHTHIYAHNTKKKLYGEENLPLKHPITPPLKVLIVFPMGIVTVQHINTPSLPKNKIKAVRTKSSPKTEGNI